MDLQRMIILALKHRQSDNDIVVTQTVLYGVRGLGSNASVSEVRDRLEGLYFIEKIYLVHQKKSVLIKDRYFLDRAGLLNAYSDLFLKKNFSGFAYIDNIITEAVTKLNSNMFTTNRIVEAVYNKYRTMPSEKRVVEVLDEIPFVWGVEKEDGTPLMTKHRRYFAKNDFAMRTHLNNVACLEKYFNF